MKYFLICSILILLFSSCEENKQSNQVLTKRENQIRHAKYFQLIKNEKYNLLYIINPDNNKIEKKYALANDISTLKLQKDVILIKTPISKITCLTGTDIGYLDKINESEKITGVTDIKYVYNKIVKQNFQTKKVQSIQDLSQINPESLLGKTQIISYSGFGKAPTNEDKLNKLNILCIPIYDWRETNALGKAEWIKLFAILFEKEKEANSYFEQVEKEYKTLIASVKENKSLVSVLSGSLIGDSWYMPAGESFIASMFHDAEINYVNKNSKGTGSSAYSFEKVFKEHQASSIWINPGFKSKKELINSNDKYKYFKAFKTDEIYCYSHNMNHFWEMGAIEPQKVLSDLIQIVHRGKVEKKNLYFYRKITSY